MTNEQILTLIRQALGEVAPARTAEFAAITEDTRIDALGLDTVRRPTGGRASRPPRARPPHPASRSRVPWRGEAATGRLVVQAPQPRRADGAPR